MASIQMSLTNDGQLVHLTYTLNNERFTSISALSYTHDTTYKVIVDINNVAHSTTDPVSGTFSTMVSASRLKEVLGVNTIGIGVVTLRTDVGSYIDGYALFGDSLDCCIAEKVHDSLNCDCNDNSCNASLYSAQKIFLFKKSSEYVLSSLRSTKRNTEYDFPATAIAKLEDANLKYLKAVELCGSDCNC